jgi:O-antigen ligase
VSAVPDWPAPGRRAGFSLYAVWLAATVAVFVLRPGEVLELAVAGAAGYIGFSLVRSRRVELPIALTGGACFGAPLLYAWPVRTFEEHQLPGSLGALTSVGSLLPLAALLAVATWKRAVFTRVPPILAAAALLLGVAGITSSFAAAQIGSTFAATWLVYGAPISLAVAIFACTQEIRDVRLYLQLFVLGALPQLVVAIAAYVVDFGVPARTGDLVAGKAALFRPHLLQAQALGNVGHLSDFCLAVLLPALVVACASRTRTPIRAAAIATTVAAVTVLVLLLSRSAILAAVLVLGGALVALFRHPRSLVRLTAVAGTAFVLVAISIAPSVRRSYESLVPTSTATSTTQVGTPSSDAGAESTAFRLAAQRTAWDIARAHLPWGVGTGQYALYDPVHTAPHSLPLQALSETGILGALGWLLIAAYAAWRGAQGIIRRQRPWWLEELAAAGSVLALLLHGTIAGLTLRVGHDNTAALLLWIGLGCLAALERIGTGT